MDESVERDIEQALENTQPSLEEIAAHECGCRCGIEGCEFAADFIGSPEDVIRKDVYDAEYAADMDALEEEEQLVENTEQYEERVGSGVEFSEELDGYDEYLIPSSPEFGEEMGLPGEYPAPPAPEFGAQSDDYIQTPEFNPAEDNGEDVYHSTAEYTMISTDPQTFDSQGS